LVAANATEMKKQRERFHCHLLVLDIIMQGDNGLSICQKLRADGDTIPIVMLSGRDETVDRILGLEFGADDYITKPVEPRELVARIRAVLRRTADQTINVYEGKSMYFTFGKFVLDGHSRRLMHNGQGVPLSSDEFLLLMVMVSQQGKVLSRSQLAFLLKGELIIKLINAILICWCRACVSVLMIIHPNLNTFKRSEGLGMFLSIHNLIDTRIVGVVFPRASRL